MMTKKGLILTVLVTLLLVVVGFSVWELVKPKPNLSLVVSPSPATLVLDGKQNIHPGKLRLPPGDHKISASMNGFSSKITSFNIQTDKLSTVTIILIPNSSEGTSWLASHPNEALLREGVSNQQYTQQSQQVTANAPLIKELPYIGAGFEFRIDYGSNQADPTKPTIIITGATTQAQQDALTWIKGQGYDPANYTIQYITAQP